MGLLCPVCDGYRSAELKIVRTGLEPGIFIFFAAYAASFALSVVPAVSVIESYKLAADILGFYSTVTFCSDRAQLQNLCGIILVFGGILW